MDLQVFQVLLRIADALEKQNELLEKQNGILQKIYDGMG